MTGQIAGFYELTSSPVPDKFHAEDLDFPVRLGLLSGIGLGRVEELSIVPRCECPKGF